MNFISKFWNEHKASLFENIRVIIEALLIALVIRTVIIQPFNIPSGSMKSGLLVGDFLMSSKWSYGYSKYSIPFAPPLFNGRIFGSEPQRGDVAIFRPPHELDNDYIKRVIGVAGDKIQVKDGVLHINGVAAKLERVENMVDEGTGKSYPQFRETLPNGVSYLVVDSYDKRFSSGRDSYETPVYEVPKGHYFMMGDNRGNSADSRVFGPVPYENFVAKAQILFFSVKEGESALAFWKLPFNIRYDRLMKFIK